MKDDDSEKWCMSKHLLASSMRLFEIGNRYLHEQEIEEAKQSYNDSAELYALFWKLNLRDKFEMPISNNSINYGTQEKKSIFSGIKRLLECCKE